MNSTTVTPDISATPRKKPTARLPWIILIGLLLAVVMSAAGYLIGRSLRPHQMHGTQLEPSLPAANFTMLSATTEQPVSLNDYRGKFVLLYFGYATCPDVCPTSLSHYTQSYRMLSQEAQDNIEFLWITVDPDRDTPAVLKEYISHFEPEFMTGLIPRTPAELADTAKAFGAHYEKIDVGSEAGYLMDHSGSVALIDPAGNWRLVYPFAMPSEEVAADLEYLVKTEIR